MEGPGRNPPLPTSASASNDTRARMKFHTRKRRQPAIIIVSLIDILAILLIFFIVTTTFRKTHPQLEISLPESKRAEQSPDQNVQPSLLQVAPDDRIMLDGNELTLDGLAPELRAWRSAHPEKPLAMQADRQAPFGTVVKVLDALKDAGLENIPAFTEPEKPAPR